MKYYYLLLFSHIKELEYLPLQNIFYILSSLANILLFLV